MEFGATKPLYLDRLESAVSRQTTGSFDTLKWNRLHHVAATLFFGLVNNHAFENGDKRTALVSLLVLVDKNNQTLSGVSQDELYELATETANWRASRLFDQSEPDSVVIAIGSRFRSSLRRRETGYRNMRMRDFLAALRALGCTVERPDRSFVRIHPPDWAPSGRTIKIAYADEGRDVQASYVLSARQSLGLTSDQGVTASTFFDLDPAVDEFVLEYSEVLTRLADT